MQHYELLMGAELPMNGRLAAILAADVAGYSRLMHEDEAATVRDLKAYQSVGNGTTIRSGRTAPWGRFPLGSSWPRGS